MNYRNRWKIRKTSQIANSKNAVRVISAIYRFVLPYPSSSIPWPDRVWSAKRAFRSLSLTPTLNFGAFASPILPPSYGQFQNAALCVTAELPVSLCGNATRFAKTPRLRHHPGPPGYQPVSKNRTLRHPERERLLTSRYQAGAQHWLRLPNVIHNRVKGPRSAPKRRLTLMFGVIWHIVIDAWFCFNKRGKVQNERSSIRSITYTSRIRPCLLRGPGRAGDHYGSRHRSFRGSDRKS